MDREDITMDPEVRELNEEEVQSIEDRLDAFDREHMPCQLPGHVRIGAFQGGRLIAGAAAGMTAFRILYLSTLFVEAEHRSRGIGRKLMAAVEREARALGANMIRLDPFDGQGRDFYRSPGFEEVGSWSNEVDAFPSIFP